MFYRRKQFHCPKLCVVKATELHILRGTLNEYNAHFVYVIFQTK